MYSYWYMKMYVTQTLDYDLFFIRLVNVLINIFSSDKYTSCQRLLNRPNRPLYRSPQVLIVAFGLVNCTLTTVVHTAGHEWHSLEVESIVLFFLLFCRRIDIYHQQVRNRPDLLQRCIPLFFKQQLQQYNNTSSVSCHGLKVTDEKCWQFFLQHFSVLS